MWGGEHQGSSIRGEDEKGGRVCEDKPYFESEILLISKVSKKKENKGKYEWNITYAKKYITFRMRRAKLKSRDISHAILSLEEL